MCRAKVGCPRCFRSSELLYNVSSCWDRGLRLTSDLPNIRGWPGPDCACYPNARANNICQQNHLESTPCVDEPQRSIHKQNPRTPHAIKLCEKQTRDTVAKHSLRRQVGGNKIANPHCDTQMCAGRLATQIHGNLFASKVRREQIRENRFRETESCWDGHGFGGHEFG